MKYNPNIHHRRSIRLKGYDYSRAGMYFITICCQNRICRFGEIENDKMQLNEFGKIAYDEWVKLPERFNNMQMDVFQIMPNHMHSIVSLVGATLAVAPDGGTVAPGGDTAAPNDNSIDLNKKPDGRDKRHRTDPRDRTDSIGTRANATGAEASPAPTVGDIVGAYKSLVANGCLDICKSKNETMGKLWQRNYYEHIIRNEKSYHKIADYIINNPANWKNDKFHYK